MDSHFHGNDRKEIGNDIWENGNDRKESGNDIWGNGNDRKEKTGLVKQAPTLEKK